MRCVYHITYDAKGMHEDSFSRQRKQNRFQRLCKFFDIRLKLWEEDIHLYTIIPTKTVYPKTHSSNLSRFCS